MILKLLTVPGFPVWALVALCTVFAVLSRAEICQGGDTIEDATVIPGIPFFAEGTTDGFADDYDAWCIAGSENAPDVVYVISPAADGEISIDLCGSSFNTAVYVIPAVGSQSDCNDNRSDSGPCGGATSRLDRYFVTAGSDYYIVIDGAGTIDNSGSYNLSVASYSPHELHPPWYAQLENEPQLVDGYVDMYNGGCDADVPQFQFHSFDPGFGYNASMYGRSGWYDDPEGITSRDSDWYTVFLISSQNELNLTIEATDWCRVSWFNYNSTCDDLFLVDSISVGPSATNEMVIYGDYASDIWVKVTPFFPEPPNGENIEFEYLLGVRWGNGWEIPYPAPLSDESLLAPIISHNRNRISAQFGEFYDDHSPHEVCSASAGVAKDGLVQVYLWEGQSIRATNHDIWYPGPLRDRNTDICFYLVTDARMTPGSCVGSSCGGYSTYFSHSFTAPQAGWHYLICDFDEDATDVYVEANVVFPQESPYQPPPEPPLGDGCDTAPTIPRGPFLFAGDLTNATNRFDPGRDGCVDDPGLHWTGGDVVYRVDLLAGDRLQATLGHDGEWDAAMYLVSDCEDPLGNCVASGLQLQHVAFESQTLWLVCDSWGIGPRTFTLSGSLDSLSSSPEVENTFGIKSIQPNPCNPITTVEFVLSQPSPVKLGVYDLRGRLVETLVDEPRHTGSHREIWDGNDNRGRQVASGIYVLRLSVGDLIDSRSVAVLR